MFSEAVFHGISCLVFPGAAHRDLRLTLPKKLLRLLELSCLEELSNSTKKKPGFSNMYLKKPKNSVKKTRFSLAQTTSSHKKPGEENFQPRFFRFKRK